MKALKILVKLILNCLDQPHAITYTKSRHAFRVLTASKPMKLNLILQTWKLLVYVARFRKKSIIVWRTLATIVEKIKVTKLTYFITPLLHSSNPLWQKDVSQKLVFTVAVLLKGNRSSFSKQLGINCTCQQIGLFLISTPGCGSHSWKLLKSPICSLVQLIPNCFENRPISYTYRGTPGSKLMVPRSIPTTQCLKLPKC